jgi:hypothetical protein
MSVSTHQLFCDLDPTTTNATTPIPITIWLVMPPPSSKSRFLDTGSDDDYDYDGGRDGVSSTSSSSNSKNMLSMPSPRKHWPTMWGGRMKEEGKRRSGAGAGRRMRMVSAPLYVSAPIPHKHFANEGYLNPATLASLSAEDGTVPETQKQHLCPALPFEFGALSNISQKESTHFVCGLQFILEGRWLCNVSNLI